MKIIDAAVQTMVNHYLTNNDQDLFLMLETCRLVMFSSFEWLKAKSHLSITLFAHCPLIEISKPPWQWPITTT